MKLKIAIITVAWITFALNFALGQASFTLTGTIASASGGTVDDVTVYLLNSRDSLVMKTAIATKGRYEFKNVARGSYQMKVVMMGYQPYKGQVVEINQSMALPEIVLLPSTVALQEVNVSATRPYVQQKIDRTVVNPEALLSNAGGTALEILEKSPGITVDQNGAIALKGQGATIFVDDKPIYLSGTDLENYLRSLSASIIDQIELMPNPSARYDAAGNGGVINIRTKRNKIKGFNGSANLSYSQGSYGKTVNSLNLNYRINKFNLMGSFAINSINGFNDLTINRHFEDAVGNPTSNFIQNSFTRHTGENYLGKVGIDYYLSETSTLGVNFTGIYNPYQKVATVGSRFSNVQNQLDSTISAHNEQHQLFKNAGINLNFRQQLNKNGREITADIDYLAYRSDNDQEFNNNSYFTTGILKTTELLSGSLPADIHIFSAKTDYEHPLKNGPKLSIGLKSSYTETDNIADYFYTRAGNKTIDYDKTNHFSYKENINAAYVNASRDFKQFSVQIGLRLENTIANGHQYGNLKKPDSTFSRAYTNLFPTAYLQYKLDTAERNVIGINYGRRIDRPYYQNLNPFVSPIDKFTYYTGNPFLRSSFTHNIELTHTYKGRFTTSLSYSKTFDDVDETIEIVNGVYYSRPGNIGEVTVKTLAFNGSFNLSKKLTYSFNGRVSNLHAVSDFYTGQLDTKGTYFFGRSVFQLKLSKDWMFQVDGGYQSRIRSAQFDLGERGMMNAAASKKLGSTTIKIVVNDIFYTFKNTGVINNLNQTKADWTNLSDMRTVVLSLSYRFGKTIAGQRQHNADGAADEQNRVKN